jgi:hypothetical protein
MKQTNSLDYYFIQIPYLHYWWTFMPSRRGWLKAQWCLTINPRTVYCANEIRGKVRAASAYCASQLVVDADK